MKGDDMKVITSKISDERQCLEDSIIASAEQD